MIDLTTETVDLDSGSRGYDPNRLGPVRARDPSRIREYVRGEPNREDINRFTRSYLSGYFAGDL